MKLIKECDYNYIANKYHDNNKPFNSFDRFIRRDELFAKESGNEPEYIIEGLKQQDKEFYETSGGGVTISGGECLCQADFCAQLLKALKEQTINTAVDTCGYASKEAIYKVLPYTDTFLYDIKAIDDDVHIKCTSKSNKQILDNIKYIDSCGKAIEVRIPYVPNFNDNQIDKIAEFLKTLKNVKVVKILPYHNYAGSKYTALNMENTLPDILPSDEEINLLQNKFI